MPSLNASGTQTATLTTEHTLATITTPIGIYQLFVDAAALADGETLRLRVKYKVLTGGTERVLQEAIYVNAQADPIKVSLPIVSDISFVATLTQTGGTGRAFPWKIMRLDG